MGSKQICVKVILGDEEAGHAFRKRKEGLPSDEPQEGMFLEDR